MRVYRVARLIAATGGMSLAIIAGTTEAIASTTTITIGTGFRAWMVVLIVVAAISVCTVLIVERQATVAAGQEQILNLLHGLTATRDAEVDYADIERRLHEGSGNITTLYPEKE